jgi:hypothetical protein
MVAVKAGFGRPTSLVASSAVTVSDAGSTVRVPLANVKT